MRHGPSPVGRRASLLPLGSPEVPEDLQISQGPGDWIRLDHWLRIKEMVTDGYCWLLVLDVFLDNYVGSFFGSKIIEPLTLIYAYASS